MTDALTDIRAKIDAVDQQIHDLMITRAELALQIGAEKRKSGLPLIQPEREAAKMRSILAHHSGALPKAMIVRIWREIIGAACHLQTDMRVVIAAPSENNQDYWDMTRDYFGSVIPVHSVANPLSAISMLREGEVNFAVLPWPEDDTENPWWCHTGSEDPSKIVRVAVRLPYGGQQENPQCRAVIASLLPFRDSGSDNSFIFLALDDVVSRARVVDKAKALGFIPISISSRRVKQVQTKSQHLLEVEGYIADNDPRFGQLLENLESPEGRCIGLGGYPLLPSLTDP